MKMVKILDEIINLEKVNHIAASIGYSNAVDVYFDDGTKTKVLVSIEEVYEVIERYDVSV